MITSTHDLLKHFFWRYADMHITKHELHFLRDHSVKNPDYVRFLEKHSHMLRHPPSDVVNLSTVMSQLSDHDMRGLLQLFSIRAATPVVVESFDELARVVDEHEPHFYTFVVCMYYYL